MLEESSQLSYFLDSQVHLLQAPLAETVLLLFDVRLSVVKHQEALLELPIRVDEVQQSLGFSIFDLVPPRAELIEQVVPHVLNLVQIDEAQLLLGEVPIPSRAPARGVASHLARSWRLLLLHRRLYLLGLGLNFKLLLLLLGHGRQDDDLLIVLWELSDESLSCACGDQAVLSLIARGESFEDLVKQIKETVWLVHDQLNLEFVVFWRHTLNLKTLHLPTLNEVDLVWLVELRLFEHVCYDWDVVVVSLHLAKHLLLPVILSFEGMEEGLHPEGKDLRRLVYLGTVGSSKDAVDQSLALG